MHGYYSLYRWDKAGRTDEIEMKKYVGYIRESTLKWLTPEAQREVVAQHLAIFKGRLVSEYTVEVSRSNEAEQIEAALRDCRCFKARLLIPYLERVDLAGVLLSALIESRVRFEVARTGNTTNRRVVDALNRAAEAYWGKRANVARRRRKASNPGGLRRDGTSSLTKDAREKGTTIAVQVRKEKADAFADRVRFKIEALIDQGKSHYAVAKILNEMRVRTATGKVGKWDATKVRRVLARPPGFTFEAPSRTEEERWKETLRKNKLGPAAIRRGGITPKLRDAYAAEWALWVMARDKKETAEDIAAREAKLAAASEKLSRFLRGEDESGSG